MLPNRRVPDRVELEQLQRIRQRSRGDDVFVRASGILEHSGEHIDVRGVGDFKPDMHASPAASGWPLAPVLVPARQVPWQPIP